MRSPKLLIADDNIRLLEALKIRLEAEGFEVITSQDAYQALDLARRHHPAVLLLDVNMPAGDGFSVQERIANCAELAKTPIIYLTGQAAETVDRKAERLGAFAVVHKPFEFCELVHTIHAAIDQSGSEGACDWFDRRQRVL